MSNIAVTTEQGVTVETFVKAAAEGKVRFYRVRENGTYRHIQFLADGTKEREVAEWIAGQREEGVTMKAIASDINLSVPSVRRILNSLLLTEEVEEYDESDIEPLLAETEEEAAEATETTETPAAVVLGPLKADGTF